ncbi:MAG TPA: serine hydrolase [Burkholderiaceae bacterium]|nr:serine hydrolase [Burkholderiaceae bacterium]
MNRRRLLQATALGAFSTVLAPTSNAQGRSAALPDLKKAITDFTTLSPGRAAACISIEEDNGSRSTVHAADPDQPLFVGSAVKTFILAQYLREVEAGRLSEDTQVAVGPEVWSPGSPVFMHLTGTTPARSALEAMIAHSDNTGTDIALNAAGADQVRQLIKTAGLTHTLIPDSTRKLFSYLAGAPNGVDIGWAGMEKMAKDIMPGKPRKPVNDHQTMMSTAGELTRWYEQALAGKYFKKHETLAEFKRISAMANAMPMMVPEDVMAYGKGGSIDWGDFHCFCGAGQMVQTSRRTSFCFILNWTGADGTVPTMLESFKKQSRHVLSLAANSRAA